MRSSLGQMTVFMILAALILLMGVFSFSVLKDSWNDKAMGAAKESNTPSFAVPVRAFVQECIRQASYDAAQYFGQSQSYVKDREYPYGPDDTALYYAEGKDMFPSQLFFERQLSSVVADSVTLKCGDFADFEGMGYAVSSKKARAKATIAEGKVSLEIMYPLTVRQGSDLAQISAFSVDLPLRIGHLLGISEELVRDVEREPYALDLTSLMLYDVDISVFGPDRCTRIYMLIDNESRMPGGEPYMLSFGVRLLEKFCAPEEGNNRTLVET